jgi:hypothetical protein
VSHEQRFTGEVEATFWVLGRQFIFFLAFTTFVQKICKNGTIKIGFRMAGTIAESVRNGLLTR